jgi:type VI secretion system secreted protein Hcp
MAIYIKFSDIEGDATAEGHEGEMQLENCSMSVGHSGNPAEASSHATGMVHAAPISFMKYVDRSTPLMIQACCNGQIWDDEVIISHTKKVKDETIDYFVITLGSAQIIDDSISSAGDGAPAEVVSLAYGEIRWEYFPLGKGGDQDGVTEAEFSLITQASA